jgi:hypothetical protein
VVDWFIPASQQTQGAKDTGVNLLWYDPVSGSRAPIASYKVTRDFIFIPPGRPPHGSQIPFTVFPDAAVTADGGLITGGTAFQIRDVGLGGEIRRILRLDLAPQPVTDAIIEAWLDSELSGPNAGTGLREQILKSMPLPDTLPAFESLLIDELGCVWAQIFEWSPEVPKQWVVFDAEGAALGAVETPPGLRVEWIGPDGILGVWKDDFDVEQVHRHRLERQRDECLVS